MNFVIDHIGGACPVQGYGTIDGQRFYFRFRANNAQLYVGPEDPDDPGMPDRDATSLYAEINGYRPGQDLLGVLEPDEATDLLSQLIGMLRPPGEWTYGTRLDRMR